MLTDRAGCGGGDVGFDAEGALAGGAGDRRVAIPGEGILLESAGAVFLITSRHATDTSGVSGELAVAAKRTKSNLVAEAP